MRIGCFSSSLPEPTRKPGGVDIYVDRLAEKLAQRGHEVVMYSYSAAPATRAYRHVQVSPPVDPHSTVGRLAVIPARLNQLDTAGLDLLHLHGDDWFFVRRRVPTVRTFYGSALYEARHGTRLRRRVSQYTVYGLELLASRLATATYGISPGDGPGYRTAGHLPLAIDLPPAHEPMRSGPPTVLFVGTWMGRKRGLLLHESFQRDVLPRVPDAQLVMVADHCEPGPSVRWLRRPSDAELQELYAAASVFCLPSSYEGFGLPYLEAMSFTTPVVATTNPGSRYVLSDGRHGLITTEDRLGSTIADLLLDEDARQELAVKGRERAEDFGWEPILQRHERVYADVIDRWR
jgi:glycosyltransferase involved in cell wall biosynthesis